MNDAEFARLERERAALKERLRRRGNRVALAVLAWAIFFPAVLVSTWGWAALGYVIAGFAVLAAAVNIAERTA